MTPMNTSITTDILVVIPLIFTVYLARKNVIASASKTKYYILATLLTLVELILEIATEIFQSFDSTQLIFFHIMANVIGFSLMPVVALIFAFLHNDKLVQYKTALSIPLVLNGLIILSSPRTGWIFSITPDNGYMRGEYFWVQALFTFCYFFILFASDLYMFRNNNSDDKILLMSIYFFPVIGGSVQLIFPDLLLLWGCVSISLLLYYLFLRELQFKYDALTEIPNRAAFKKEMKACGRIPKVLIAVFDLNDLKKINDVRGHVVGDNVIKQAGLLIKECFHGYGTPFRIGGDEFCVICRNITESVLKERFEVLKGKTMQYNISVADPIHIAYGYSFFDPCDMNDIYEAFAIADRRMYENKYILKTGI